MSDPDSHTLAAAPMEAEASEYKLTLFPLDDQDYAVETCRKTFKAAVHFVFENTAADASDPRDFHVTIDWARVADPAQCAVPKPLALP
jgi:hypothetical protein